MARRFFFILDVIAESEDGEGIPSSVLPVIYDLVFLYAILKHCKWIMFRGPAFINESGHIKNLKIITKTVDFGIPTIEIFLNKKYISVQ